MPYQDPYLVTLSLGAFLPPSIAEHPHKTHILAHNESEGKKRYPKSAFKAVTDRTRWTISITSRYGL